MDDITVGFILGVIATSAIWLWNGLVNIIDRSMRKYDDKHDQPGS